MENVFSSTLALTSAEVRSRLFGRKERMIRQGNFSEQNSESLYAAKSVRKSPSAEESRTLTDSSDGVTSSIAPRTSKLISFPSKAVRM